MGKWVPRGYQREGRDRHAKNATFELWTRLNSPNQWKNFARNRKWMQNKRRNLKRLSLTLNEVGIS